MIPATGPNLARDPFANARPLHRLAALLWVLALALTAWNVHAYLASGAGATARRAELEQLRRESAESRQRIETLEADLERADLVRANLQTEYLNQRIAERAFSWNLLFDHMVEVMPRQVRVQRLAPQGFRDDGAARTGRAPSSAERLVTLYLSGEAADDELLLEFVDRLFAHPSFDAPNLTSEARNREGGLDFELSVGYRPAGRDRQEPAAPGAAAAGATAAVPGEAAVGADSAAAAEVVFDLALPPAAAQAAATEAPAGSEPPASGAGSGAVGASRAVSTARPGAPDAVGGRTGPAAPEREAAVSAVGADLEPETGAAAPAPTPALSIFGAPLGAKPYASGGGR